MIRLPAFSRKQRGMTLVEIMVAIGISAILLAGVLQILMGNQQSYRTLEATSRVQESGRFAISFMTEDLRMAGYSGCFSEAMGPVDNILRDEHQDSFDWDLSMPLTGHEWTGADWSPPLPAEIAGRVREGTDVIVMRGMSDDGIHLVDPYSLSAQLFVNNEGDVIQNDDVIMISDCSSASVAQITNVQGTGFGTNLTHGASGMNRSPPHFNKLYGADAEVARLQSSVYFIGDGANGEPALFRRSLIGSNPEEQELVDGVENLQALYGEDLDDNGFANRYVTADEITDSDAIVSVRISLLLRTGDHIATAPQTYLYDGETVEANDRRIRRVFNSTVKLRNRGAL